MDSSEVGRYGTLRLMKRLEPHKVVASYPIDQEEVTFGRAPSCSIRLYYESVSALHAKVIFRDRKAFLVVIGVNGVIVDGCPVFPAITSSGSPVTVPLPNQSSIEINKKIFQFSYPPKDIRLTLLDTPTPTDIVTPDKKRRRRTLRMSMIQSAQVFTPGPSQNPRENLRILKTPIKTPFSSSATRLDTRRRRESSPLKRGMYLPPPQDDSDEDEREEDIVLVETNHPKVVEEDRDLVILEHVIVDVPETESRTQPLVQFPIPQDAQPQVQQTPQKKGVGSRTSLHRAVLIRSAQRTVMRMEMEEEEMDAEEVEETIQALEGLVEDDEEEEENNDDTTSKGDDDYAAVNQEAGRVGEEMMEQPEQRSTPSTRWRGLGLVTQWASGTSAPPSPGGLKDEGRHPAPHQEASTHTSEPESEDLNHKRGPSESNFPSDSRSDVPSLRRTTPRPLLKSPRHPHRTPGNFMTPQAGRAARSSRHVRYSVGGFTPGGIYGAPSAPPLHAAPVSSGPIVTSTSEQNHTGPRRIRLVEPWKVEDIVVPIHNGSRDEDDWQDEDDDAGNVVEPDEQEAEERQVRLSTMSASPSKRPVVSEEERKAILERRRSALVAPDSFFGGQAPGLRRMSLFSSDSPLKPPLKASAMSSTPARILASTFVDTSDSSTESNPFNPPSASRPTTENVLAAEDSDPLTREEEHEETQVLLARMKQTIENAKRRQSMGRPSIGLSVGVDATPSPKKAGGFSLLAPEAGNTPVRRIEVAESQEDGHHVEADDKENAERFVEEHEDVQMYAVGQASYHRDNVEVQMPARLVDLGTPPFAGVRELLSSRAQSETPRMESMQELFRTERFQTTPAFDGLGEMLQSTADCTAHDDNTDNSSPWDIVDSVAGPSQPHSPTTSPTMKVPSLRVSSAASKLATGPALAKAPFKQIKAKTIPGGLRITPVYTAGPARPTPPVEYTSREPPSIIKNIPSHIVAVPSTGPHEATRQENAIVNEPIQHDIAMDDPKPIRPVRRTTRKTSASPVPEQPSTMAKTTRRSTRKTPTPTPEDLPLTKAAESSRRRPKTPTLPDVDEENINTVDGEEDGKKVRRSARRKLTMEIKEEDAGDSSVLATNRIPVPVRSTNKTVARTSRGKNPGENVGTSDLSRSTSASRLRAPTPALSTKNAGALSAGVAAKAMGASDHSNKENTPERQTAPEYDSYPATAMRSAAAPATRVARSSGRTKVASVEQESTEKRKHTAVTGARVSRAKPRK